MEKDKIQFYIVVVMYYILFQLFLIYLLVIMLDADALSGHTFVINIDLSGAHKWFPNKFWNTLKFSIDSEKVGKLGGC